MTKKASSLEIMERIQCNGACLSRNGSTAEAAEMQRWIGYVYFSAIRTKMPLCDADAMYLESNAVPIIEEAANRLANVLEAEGKSTREQSLSKQELEELMVRQIDSVMAGRVLKQKHYKNTERKAAHGL